MDGDDLTNLWYIWFILIIIGTLIACGVVAGCVRTCCRSSKPAVPAFPGQHLDVAVINVDHGSNLSTVSSFSLHLPSEVSAELRNPFSPPPYSLYALESPPQYDEALMMPSHKHVIVPATLEDRCHVAPESPPIHMSVDRAGGQNTRDKPVRDSRREFQDAASWEEEDPPEYHLYDPMTGQNFTEISLTEPDERTQDS